MFQEEDLAAARRIEVMRRQAAAASPRREGTDPEQPLPSPPTTTHHPGGAGWNRTVTYPGSGSDAQTTGPHEPRMPPSPRVTPPNCRASAPTEGYVALLPQQVAAPPFPVPPSVGGAPGPPPPRPAATATATSSRRGADGRGGSAPARRGVPHVYHDHSQDPLMAPGSDAAAALAVTRKKQGGVTTPFPEKLYEMLESPGVDPAVVAWSSHGRSFHVKLPKRFTKEIMPQYFRQTKLTSFQRQLNLYGFRRLTRGPDSGAYYHEMFLRGRPALCYQMRRQKVKGTGHKQPADANTEPNFYAMPPLAPTAACYGQSYTVGVPAFDPSQPPPAPAIASPPRPSGAPLVPSYNAGPVVSTSPSLQGAAHLLRDFAVSSGGFRLPAMPLLGPPATEVADPAARLPPRRPPSSGEAAASAGGLAYVPPTF